MPTQVTDETLQKLIGAFKQSTKLQTQLLEQIKGTQAKQPTQSQSTPNHASLKFEEFHQEKESISIYLERLKVFLQLHGLPEAKPAADAPASASPPVDQHNDTKRNILLNSIGSTHYQVIKDLCLPKNVTDKSFIELCNLLEDHYNPQTNIFRERNRFFNRIQSPAETIAQYIIELRRLSLSCDFKCPSVTCGISVADQMLTSQLIRGLRNETIRERLLEKSAPSESEEQMTFTTASKIALSLEDSQNSSKEMSKSTQAENTVHRVDSQRRQGSKAVHQSRFRNQNSDQSSHFRNRSQSNRQNSRDFQNS